MSVIRFGFPFVAVCLVACSSSPAASVEAPWPIPVEGFVPVQPGEHPRLFFRKSDLPELKRRATTPEGQAIVARLKALLGGGEAMPKHFTPATSGLGASPECPLGSYTLWHGAGFGLLYQITGNRMYADLGRECVEKAFAGTRDIDARNAFIKPTSSIRGGPSIAAIATAYDLCYDGWEPAFREKVCSSIMTWKQPGEKGGGSDYSSVERVATNPKLGPNSNHFGMNVGGGAIAILAILGDKGADDEALRKWLPIMERNLMRAVTEGFGSGGYFHEDSSHHIAANQSLVPAFQAMKVCAGKDFTRGRPNVRCLPLRYAIELLPSGNDDGACVYPLPWGEGGYGTDSFDRGSNSHGGHFAQGFGVLPSEVRPAYLWVYRKFVEPGEDKAYARLLKPGEKSYDGLLYPQRAMLALVNWPIGVEPVNPEKLIPKVLVDDLNQHYVFRNRWQDADDTLVSVTLNSRKNGATSKRCLVWGLRQRCELGSLDKCKAKLFDPRADGSGVLATEGGSSIGVDFSKASGAEALVVIAGPAANGGQASGKGKIATVTAGGTPFSILTLTQDAHPEPTVEGDTVKVGGQTIKFDNTRIVFGKMAGPLELKQ